MSQGSSLRQIGTHIRARRTELGLSQRRLAQAVDLKSTSFISYIESGRQPVSAELAGKFAKVLGGDPQDFRTGNKDPDKELDILPIIRVVANSSLTECTIHDVGILIDLYREYGIVPTPDMVISILQRQKQR